LPEKEEENKNGMKKSLILIFLHSVSFCYLFVSHTSGMRNVKVWFEKLISISTLAQSNPFNFSLIVESEEIREAAAD
jgi:hypothetical protein